MAPPSKVTSEEKVASSLANLPRKWPHTSENSLKVLSEKVNANNSNQRERWCMCVCVRVHVCCALSFVVVYVCVYACVCVCGGGVHTHACMCEGVCVSVDIHTPPCS